MALSLGLKSNGIKSTPSSLNLIWIDLAYIASDFSLSAFTDKFFSLDMSIPSIYYVKTLLHRNLYVLWDNFTYLFADLFYADFEI